MMNLKCIKDNSISNINNLPYTVKVEIEPNEYAITNYIDYNMAYNEYEMAKEIGYRALLLVNRKDIAFRYNRLTIYNIIGHEAAMTIDYKYLGVVKHGIVVFPNIHECIKFIDEISNYITYIPYLMIWGLDISRYMAENIHINPYVIALKNHQYRR